MDAVDLLISQHREVESLFEEFERLDRGDTDRRREIMREVITKLSVHAGIEETAFYPTVRDAIPGMRAEIDHDLEEHKEAKEVLNDLQGMEPDDEEFDRLATQLIQDVRHHVEDEEGVLFPKVREILSEEELQELGQTMDDLQGLVPTNPHPHEPQKPPANTALGPITGAVDRLRDRIRERLRDEAV